jgi:hypothetical protein
MASDTAQYIINATGEKVLAPSLRPDGTLRKERRIRAGYTPQDEQPVYQSGGVTVRSLRVGGQQQHVRQRAPVRLPPQHPAAGTMNSSDAHTTRCLQHTLAVAPEHPQVPRPRP